MLFVGYGSITFNSLAKTTLQLAAEPSMRGRVMALWALAWLGSTPIGGPIVGWLGQAVGRSLGPGRGRPAHPGLRHPGPARPHPGRPPPRSPRRPDAPSAPPDSPVAADSDPAAQPSAASG